LNRFLKEVKFKYESIYMLGQLVEKDMWMGKVDVASGYHVIPIHKEYRKYLGIRWQVKVYRFACLAFGISIAPWVYTRTMKELMKRWRGLLFTCQQYLDDGWWGEKSWSRWFEIAETIISDLLLCGFWPSVDKSVLTPVKLIEQIGLVINSEDLTFNLPARREQKILDIIAPVVEENKVVTTLDNVRSLAGCMVSCELAVGGARIHLRNIYRLVVKYELVSRHRSGMYM